MVDLWELKLQTGVAVMSALGCEPGPLPKQPELLAAEPSHQPHFLTPWVTVILKLYLDMF